VLSHAGLSPGEREADNREILWEGYANADGNGPRHRDGNNGSNEGKRRVCSNKRK